MQDDNPLIVPKNPSQVPPSQFRLSRNLKVRGDAIYIIFAGIVGAVFLFFCLMDFSAILAVAVSWIPLVISLWFYFKFVRDKPRYYFDYWLNGLFSKNLCVDFKRAIRLKERSR